LALTNDGSVQPSHGLASYPEPTKMKQLWTAVAAARRLPPRASLPTRVIVPLCASLIALTGCSGLIGAPNNGQPGDRITSAPSQIADLSPMASTATGSAAEESAAEASASGESATEPAAEYRLDAGLPYRARRSEPVTHEVDFQVV